MPVSVVVAFESARGPLAPGGQQLHGWLLNCVSRIDARLGDRLHAHDRAKPFAIMSLDDLAGAYRWHASVRVTSLDEDFGRLLENLDHRDFEHEHLGRHPVRLASITASRLDHPLARAESYEALVAKAATQQATRTIGLEFLTPTSFSAAARDVTLFPHPHLVFRSLAAKWNRHAPGRYALDPGLVDELCSSTRVEGYDLRTHLATVAAGTLPGFVGSCTFSQARGGRTHVWQVAHLLAEFALYASVGQKTTMGMGQAVRRAS